MPSVNLSISLLGDVQVVVAGSPLPTFATHKVLALLAYLSIERQRAHPRDELCGLLWPEQSDSEARVNLRSTLHRLRMALGAVDDRFAVTRDSVQFRFLLGDTLDLSEFARLSANDTIAELEQALALYHGPLLSNLRVRDCALFDEWLTQHREAQHRSAVDVARRLTELHLLRSQAVYLGQAELAEKAARQHIALEPLDESGHRNLMRALVLRGQRAAALTHFENLRAQLEQEMGLTPEPETLTLCADLLKQTSVHSSADDRSSQIPPSKASFSRQSSRHPPRQLTPFIGRENEVEVLATRILAADYPLITLLGFGGMGKTRLAIAVAERVRDQFEHAICFVALASAIPSDKSDEHAHEQVMAAVAEALNLPLDAKKDAQTQVINYLCSKHMLLVLDNFEHVVAARMALVELLQNAPRIKILVTSRERLNVQAEFVMRLEGLSVPLNAASEQANHHASVRLFQERATRMGAMGVSEATEALDQMIDICRLVQGVPLALELAAAMSNDLTLREITKAIQDNLDHLTTRMSDIPMRHRCMRAVFEASWQLLNTDERRILAEMAVFHNSCDDVAALNVSNATPELLVRLVDKSLLQRDDQQRYYLHELLRQFAQEALNQNPSISSGAYQRYSDHYLQRLMSQHALLYKHIAHQTAAEMRVDLENFRQAWSHAIDQCQESADIAYVDIGIQPLSRLYELLGLAREGERIFSEGALRLAALKHDVNKAYTHAFANCLIEQGRFLNLQGKFEVSAKNVMEALELASSMQDQVLEANALTVLGSALVRLARYEEGCVHTQRALVLARTLDLKYLQMMALNVLGVATFLQGDYTQARECFEQTHDLALALGDLTTEGAAVSNLGLLARLHDDHAQARAYLERSMALARETGDRVREAVSLFNLGGLLCAESDWQRAQAYLRQSVQLRRDFGDRKGEGNALGSLGDVAMNLGDYALAADYFDESLALAREVGDRMGECWVLGSQALQSLHTNDFIRAQMHSEQAFALAECTGLRHAQARPLTILGQALIGQQRLEEAHAAYLRSLNLRRDLGETSQTLDALAGLAEVALLQGHLEVARNYAEEMLPLFIPFSEADEPFRARLICYRVLCACNDPQSAALAVKLLDDSRKLLAASAASIDDLKMRDSFMHRVLVNRILLG